mgnify:CR=1 FL=1
MFATIQVSPYIHVQGLITRTLPNGQIAIVDGDREYIGLPLRCERRQVWAVTPGEHFRHG